MSVKIPALGSLNQRVELISRQTAIDASGGQVTSFSSIGTVWANIRTQASGIGEQGDAASSFLAKTVTIRFRADISVGDRMKVGNAQYDIDHVVDINGRRAYLRCYCSEPTSIGSRHE
ncbi:phage head closure protein [Maritalea sp.]|uniref:phage head closure protein n=1 Tax=Maritalea sp. TaxID=2003361 RepID=UPI003EF720A9